MEDLQYWLAAIRIPNLGAIMLRNIYEHFGSMEKFWKSAAHEISRIEGIDKRLYKNILKYRKTIDPKKELEKVQKSGIRVITYNSGDYPKNLRNIYDAPVLIYIKGKLLPEDNLAVAVVGSRKATSYGKHVAYRLAGELASCGITIVSGMANGIDSWAHKGALKAGGRTIAVMGNGVDYLYPKTNKDLYYEIMKSGAIVSEFPPGTLPHPSNFPKRNRIISGLSLGVVVVEAAQKSGALITADFALEQGREVFAVPGNITSLYSRGTNELIKQGAKLVEHVEDVLNELQLWCKIDKKAGNPKQDEEISLSWEEKKILNLISYQATLIDYIIIKSGLPANKVNSILTALEIKGKIKQIPGGSFIRV